MPATWRTNSADCASMRATSSAPRSGTREDTIRGCGNRTSLQARTDLWDFRLAHAKARIAAQRGKIAEARKQAQKARAILDRGRIPEQEEYFPYLEGYIAFYASDYAEALSALNRASPNDPFIQCLIARTYEAAGRPRAMRPSSIGKPRRRLRTACPPPMRSHLRAESLPTLESPVLR